MKIDRLTIKTMSKIGSSASFFSLAMEEAMKSNDELCVLVADVSRYSGLSKANNKFPDRIINVGIAEQDMIGIAAGMALQGQKVYVVTYASFVVARALEQLRHNASVLGLDICIVGINAGYSMEDLGVSHWATEDIAFTRCLPGMKVVCPADNLEAYKVCIESAKVKGPMYVRLSGTTNDPIVYENDYEFSLGKTVLLKNGDDALIICHGSMVKESLKATYILAGYGLEVAVANMHTVKPLDYSFMDKAVEEFDVIFVIEEHNVIGGLGSAISEYVAEKVCSTKVVRMGMQDRIYHPGSRRYIWEQAGICDHQIAEQIIKNLRR